MGEPITEMDYKYSNTHKNKYSLIGLKNLKGLEGAKFETEESDGFRSKTFKPSDKEISEVDKKTIREYPLDFIIIDQQGNADRIAVDNFLRLNQNPSPIGYNSFEMWNSFDIVKAIRLIKEVAKYKLFKQYGKQMKEEELVTVLAYTSLKEITIDNMEEFFSVYKRLENKDRPNEHYEVQISIKNKEAITNYLEDLNPNSKEEEEILECVNLVNLFSEKLKSLSNNDHNKLIELFNPYINTPRKGNMKDFYITWLILNKLDMHIISTYKDDILKDLDEIFRLMKKMPENKTEKDFIEHVKTKINHYAKYASKVV